MSAPGLVTELAEALKAATTALMDAGALHDLDCPEDDTCECALSKTLNKAIARATPEAVRMGDVAPALLDASRRTLDTLDQAGNHFDNGNPEAARESIARYFELWSEGDHAALARAGGTL